MTGLDPATSLAMTYLRAYVDEHRTRRGMRRATRKAEHQLRMHWSACATMPARGSVVAADGLNPPNPSDCVSAVPNRLESAFQPVRSQGGLMDRITWTGGL